MNSENTWKMIIDQLQGVPAEIATVPSNKKEPLWFTASIDKGNLYIQSAINHKPSSMISKRRKISRKDFETVYSYYHRWANGETYLKREAIRISQNTSYIFALIAHFNKGSRIGV